MALTFYEADNASTPSGTSGSLTTLASTAPPSIADGDDVHVLFNHSDNGKRIGGIKITNASGGTVHVHIDGIHSKSIAGGTAGADPEATSAWTTAVAADAEDELNLWEWDLIPNGESKEFVNQKNGIPGIGKVYAVASAASAAGILWTTTLA